jgi:hypothetical protein
MTRLPLTAILVVLLAGCSGEAHIPPETPLADAPLSPAPTEEPTRGPVVDYSEHATAVRYTRMFYDGELDLLFERFSQEMQEQVLPLERLVALYEHVVAEYGSETRVLAVDSQTKGEYRAFVRWSEFDKTDEIIEVQWILRENDEVAGFWIRPAQKRRDAVVTPAP